MKTLMVTCVMLMATMCIRSQMAETSGRIYLLAATPTIHGPVTYPADLYTIGDNRKLQFVRNIAAAADGVDFVLSAPDALVVAWPHIDPTSFSIVHFDDPVTADKVTPALDRRHALGGFIASPPNQEIAALSLGPPYGMPFEPGFLGIDLRKSPSGPRILDPLPWLNFTYAYEEGAPGGAFDVPWSGLGGTFTKDGLMRGTPVGPQLLSPRSPAQPAVSDGKRGAIVCTNGRFSIVAGAFSGGAQGVGTVLVFDRQAGTSRAFSVPGILSRLRLFGQWLAVLVVESVQEKREIRGGDLQRRIATSKLPSVAESYEDALRVQGEWMPGTLELINLETGASIWKDTNQSDSEILTVFGDQVLYRVNRQIFAALIGDKQSGPDVLLVDDENVPEIHWAFRSSR